MSASRAGPSPPAVFVLAGHPLRWRLLRELAWSDRRVRELMDALGAPQPLVSYHLRRLRAAELVSVRRSSFDGRDGYYSIDLARCDELLADARSALHPGLRPVPHAEAESRQGARAPRVLFLCTGNSARSQVAEALLRDRSGGAVEACSAGSRPKDVHPDAIRVLRARGIDSSDCRPKHLDTFRDERFDYVVTLCDRVREVCPELPGDPGTIHWSIADPAAGSEGEADTRAAFERMAAELERRIGFLLHRIDRPNPPPS